MTGAHATTSFAGLDSRRVTVRFFLSVMAGLLAFLMLAREPLALRWVASWDLLCLVEVGLSWWVITTADADATRRFATFAEPGRSTVTAVLLTASFVNLVVALYLLRHAERLAPQASLALVILSAMAVVSSWFLTHTTYGARYMRLYFRRGGGLEFPGDRAPSAMDFAYFAFTIGMCFQVSDVVIADAKIRRAALGQAMIAFAYNTAILALVLNLVLGLLD